MKPLKTDFFKQAGVVRYGVAPLRIMIVDIVRVIPAPPAALLPVLPHNDPIPHAWPHELLLKQKPKHRDTEPNDADHRDDPDEAVHKFIHRVLPLSCFTGTLVHRNYAVCAHAGGAAEGIAAAPPAACVCVMPADNAPTATYISHGPFLPFYLRSTEVTCVFLAH